MDITTLTLGQPGNTRLPDDERPGLILTPQDPSYTLRSGARQYLQAAAGQIAWPDPPSLGTLGSRTRHGGRDILPGNDRAWSSLAYRGNPTRTASLGGAFPHTLRPVQSPGPAGHGSARRRRRPCRPWPTHARRVHT